MAAFIKFLFVILTGGLGTAVAWFGFTDQSLAVPTTGTWQNPEVWRPLTNLAWGFLGGLAGGAGIVAALPKRRGPAIEIDYDRLADAVAARLAPQNGEAPDAARAEAKAEAIQRTIAKEPDAAREIAEGQTAQGFDDLEAAARADMANAARKWRDIGALAYDTDPARALTAYREATRLDSSDFGAWIYLTRLEQRQAGNTAAAQRAAEAASKAAMTDRERSVACNELGDVAVHAGDLAGARTAYMEGLQIARSLSAANPASADAKRDVSVSLNKIGNAAIQAGDFDGAKAAYEESLELARSLSASNLGSAKAVRDVSISLERLGEAAIQAGDLMEAKAAFLESLELRRSLSAANIDSAEAKRDVSVSLNKLGDAVMHAGDVSGATAAYAEGLEIARSLSTSNPGSAEAKRDVIVSLAKLAQFTGDKAYWREALPIAQDMADSGQLAPVDAGMLDYIRAQATP